MEKMDKSTEQFSWYIDFWVKHKPSVSDKILFCVREGITGPQALTSRLGVAKGNLANYCKALVQKGFLSKRVQGKVVEYGLTTQGAERLNKLLKAIT